MNTDKVTIVIPTMQKNTDLLNNLVLSLVNDECVEEVIIIDNSLKGYIFNSPKVRVIEPKENMFVNPSWNFGVREAKTEIVGLLNDDIIIPDGFCSNLISKMNPDMGIVGADGHFVTPIDDINVKPNANIIYPLKRNYRSDWFGIAMFFYKTSYYYIPDELKIYYGDDWILKENIRHKRQNYVISGQQIYHWGSLTSSENKFSELYEKETKIYNKLQRRFKDFLFSYEEKSFVHKFKILGLTIRFDKRVAD